MTGSGCMLSHRRHSPVVGLLAETSFVTPTVVARGAERQGHA